MSVNLKKTIIVPWDFSKECEISLQHAYQLAQAVGDNVMLVHFIKRPRFMPGAAAKDRFQEEIESMRAKLTKEVDRLSVEYETERQRLELALKQEPNQKRQVLQVTILPMVVSYVNLRKAINELYRSMDVNLVVTNQFYYVTPKHGLDMITILRKVKSGRLNTMPFIVVKKPPVHQYYTDLVVPMDYDKTYKETLRWVAFLSNYYRCNVNLIKPPLKDELRKKGMANNMYFTKKVLEAQDVIYGIKTADKRKEFRHEVDRFSKDIDADMILIMTNKIKKFFAGGEIKSDIPVMFINPLSKKFQSFS